MSEENELPKSWVWTTIGEVADTASGGTPSRNYPQYYGGSIPWVKSGELKDGIITSVEESITEEGLNNSSAKVFQQSTALVAMYGATVGKTGILGLDATTNQAICAIFPRRGAFTAKFITYWLQFQRQKLIDRSVGGAQPNINQEIVRNFPLPLAPLQEQHRIVSAIEQQFSRLDAGVAALQRAKAKLKRYRAAVLKAAVEGKLTETWRAEHPTTEPASQLLERILKERRAKWEADLRAKGKDPAKVKYIEPIAPDVESLPELPEGWCWVTVEQISRFVKYGSSSKTSEDATGIPVLRMGNIQEGSLDLTNLKYLPVNHPEFPNLLLESGDLLFNRTNSPELVGKSAVYHGNPTLCSYASYLISVRMLEGCLADYLCFFLNSSYGKVWVASVVSQQVGQANVNGSKLQALAFPLPPLLEQEQIIAEVERNLSVISELEAEISAILKHAERLRQSILREAFMGRLVRQDPTDEPASVLLERIRNERNNQKNNIEASIKKNRSVKVPESVAIDVVDAEQTELWESVGN